MLKSMKLLFFFCLLYSSSCIRYRYIVISGFLCRHRKLPLYFSLYSCNQRYVLLEMDVMKSTYATIQSTSCLVQATLQKRISHKCLRISHRPILKIGSSSFLMMMARMTRLHIPISIMYMKHANKLNTFHIRLDNY
jgi:hypothetical protein